MSKKQRRRQQPDTFSEFAHMLDYKARAAGISVQRPPGLKQRIEQRAQQAMDAIYEMLDLYPVSEIEVIVEGPDWDEMTPEELAHDTRQTSMFPTTERGLDQAWQALLHRFRDVELSRFVREHESDIVIGIQGNRQIYYHQGESATFELDADRSQQWREQVQARKGKPEHPTCYIFGF